MMNQVNMQQKNNNNNKSLLLNKLHLACLVSLKSLLFLHSIVFVKVHAVLPEFHSDLPLRESLQLWHEDLVEPLSYT